MTRLRIYDDHDPRQPTLELADAADIAQALGRRGVHFERWEAKSLPAEPTAEQVLVTYQVELERLRAHADYRTADLIRLTPDHPQKEALRKKFLDEHTHSEDEIRFFLHGRGLFTLHLGAQVYEVLCEARDLISVPRGTPHWFDMGPAPDFVALRVFVDPAGWIAQLTGADIAQRFPRLDAP